MAADENVELIRRWFREVWNEGRTQTIYDLLAPDGVGMGELEDGTPLRGPAEFAAFAERIRGAFPDINIVVEDAFGVGDKVVARWSGTMTHRGDHLGMPATGKKVRMTGISMARIKDNQIIEGWDNWDQLGMLKQIGVYAAPQSSLLKSA
ncbi:MAG: ester cyclase [Terriglobales bacterium]